MLAYYMLAYYMLYNAALLMLYIGPPHGNRLMGYMDGRYYMDQTFAYIVCIVRLFAFAAL